MFIQRQIIHYLESMLKKFPIVSLTGPRQSGKTTLLKNAFPQYTYINLERLDYREILLADPLGFIKSQKQKVIFDEAQRVPELFSYIQVISDENGIPGQYILSGSQSFLLNEQISQSLAGRVNINHLFPFSITELPAYPSSINETIWKGFYPRIYNEDLLASEFHPSYLQTYIERDVRSIKSIENLNTFSRFLGLCAGRAGQILNLTSLANDTGISVNTVKAWLSVLESSFILFLLPPYYKNFNKRLIKSPKLYFYDTGVLCSLLRINNPDLVGTNYMYGHLFENLIIAEIVKHFYHHGKRPYIYYWRESNGSEIDCIIETGNNKSVLIEIKGGETFNNEYLKNFKYFPNNDIIQKILIYAGNQTLVINDTELLGFNDLPGFFDKLN